jgi:hypothetical protein
MKPSHTHSNNARRVFPLSLQSLMQPNLVLTDDSFLKMQSRSQKMVTIFSSSGASAGSSLKVEQKIAIL